MTPTDFDIYKVITWSLNVRFSSSVTLRNLTGEIFVRIESRIVILHNVSFWLELIIYV